MTKIIILVEDGPRQETVQLSFDHVGPAELAQVEDLTHEVLDRLRHLAALHAKKRTPL